MTTHTLKCEDGFWNQVRLGFKNFEVRKDDRHYQKGDTLILLPWDAEAGIYNTPGAVIKGTVSFVLRGGQFGIESGYVVLALIDVVHRWSETAPWSNCS